MGFYVNPTSMSKEQFSHQKGLAVPPTFKWSDKPKGSLPVVLLDHGAHTAAAICLSEDDFNDCIRSPARDQIYSVRIDDLVTFGNDTNFNYLVKEGLIAA